MQPKGIIVRGAFSSANASALDESNSRITLYAPTENGTASSLTLSSVDQIVITDFEISSAGANTITLYDGEDTTIGLAETISVGVFSAAGTTGGAFRCEHFCTKGTYPKVKAAASGQVDVTIHGTVVKWPS